MAINYLQEIRAAVQNYLDTKVKVSISALVADVPNMISPNEGFTFSITASNANTYNGGIRLVQVSYHLMVENPAVAKLIVPPVATATARSGPSPLAHTLSPGLEVYEMHLFPADHSLNVGDSDTIAGLKGIAKGLGATNINFHISADPDMDYIFPKYEDSARVTRAVNVV